MLQIMKYFKDKGWSRLPWTHNGLSTMLFHTINIFWWEIFCLQIYKKISFSSTNYRLQLPNFLSTIYNILDLFINNQQLIFGPNLQSTEKVHPPPHSTSPVIWREAYPLYLKNFSSKMIYRYSSHSFLTSSRNRGGGGTFSVDCRFGPNISCWLLMKRPKML